MARRKTKEAKAVNLNLDKEIVERLEAYCEETGLSKTVAMERILKSFFDGEKAGAENATK